MINMYLKYKMMGNKQTTDKQPKGDFSFVNDDLSRKAFHNLYMAITETKNWKWLKTFEPDKNKGFMFSHHPNLTAIENALDHSDPANGHSGASWGWALSNMSHIACFGWDDFVARWKKQNPPKPDVGQKKKGTVSKLPASVANTMNEKEFCSAMEGAGLVDPKNMDQNNKRAYNVMKKDGMKAAVDFMFQHPTKKDNDGNPVRMDYGTMRSFYG